MVGNVGKKIMKWPAWVLEEGGGVVKCDCALKFMLVSGGVQGPGYLWNQALPLQGTSHSLPLVQRTCSR